MVLCSGSAYDLGYLVGTWNSSELVSMCFATHRNGIYLQRSACKYLLVVTHPADPVVTLDPWLAQEHIYPIAKWNSSHNTLHSVFAEDRGSPKTHPLLFNNVEEWNHTKLDRYNDIHCVLSICEWNYI